MAIVQAGPLGFDGEGLFGNINLLHTLRRRKWIGLAVGFAGFCGAVTIALIWPPVYQSTATILIEEPDVPQDLIKSTVSTYADQRLNLAPTGREIDLEASYARMLLGGRIDANLFWRRDPGNFAAAPDDKGAALRWRVGF